MYSSVRRLADDQNNSWATQLSRDKQSDIPFLCQNSGKAVFSLLDASLFLTPEITVTQFPETRESLLPSVQIKNLLPSRE